MNKKKCKWGDRENPATRKVPQDRPKQPNRDRREINQARRRFNAGVVHKTEVSFPRGRGDETTVVRIPAGEVGGSPPSDWGPWTGGESVGEPGNREDEAVRSGSFGGLGN